MKESAIYSQENRLTLKSSVDDVWDSCLTSWLFCGKNIHFLGTLIKLKQMREKVVFRFLYQNCAPLSFCCKNLCWLW